MIIIRRQYNQRLSVSSSSIGRRECITDDTLRVALKPLVSHWICQAATSCDQKQSNLSRKKQNRNGHSEETWRRNSKHHVTSQTNTGRTGKLQTAAGAHVNAHAAFTFGKWPAVWGSFRGCDGDEEKKKTEAKVTMTVGEASQIKS